MTQLQTERGMVRVPARHMARRSHPLERGLRGQAGPGPGGAFYSPGMVGAASTASRYAAMADEQLDREVEAIAGALDEYGTIDRERLADLVAAREWRPRRFGLAPHEAQREGRAVRLSRSTYAPAGHAGAAPPGYGGAERSVHDADRIEVG